MLLLLLLLLLLCVGGVCPTVPPSFEFFNFDSLNILSPRSTTTPPQLQALKQVERRRH